MCDQVRTRGPGVRRRFDLAGLKSAGLVLLVAGAAAFLLLGGCGGDGSSGNHAGEGSSVDEGAGKDAAGKDGVKDTGENGEGSGANGKDSGKNGEESGKKPKKPISLNVSPVIRSQLVHSVLAEGRLRARKETEIKAEITGNLERLLVDEGSRVRAGDLLAVLDQREHLAALEEARARHLRALSELAVNLELRQAGEVDAQARADYKEQLDELRADLKAGRLSHEEFRNRSLELELVALQRGAFRRDVLEARTGFSEAKAAEERALLNLERTEIRAPFAGTITDLTPAVGERIYAAQILCRLVNARDLEAEVYVLESDLGSLQVGYPALLTITAVDQVFPVRVSVVSPDVDIQSRTCRVLFRFENDSPRIRPGMFVRAEIATAVLADRLLVPKEAILTREKRPLVFKVDEGKAVWIYVDTGERNNLYVEITGVAPGQTLEEGDRVVISDHLTLAHEAAIKVRKTITPKDPWRKNFAAKEG